MADFTTFGKPTTEWLNHEKIYGYPPAPPIGRVPPEQIQQAINDGREVVSAEQMKGEGTNQAPFSRSSHQWLINSRPVR